MGKKKIVILIIMITLMITMLVYQVFLFINRRSENKELPESTGEIEVSEHIEVSGEGNQEIAQENSEVNIAEELGVFINITDDSEMYPHYFRGSKKLEYHVYLEVYNRFMNYLSVADYFNAGTIIYELFPEYAYPTEFDVSEMMSRYFDMSYVMHINEMELVFVSDVLSRISNGEIFAIALANSRPDIQLKYILDDESLIMQSLEDLSPVFTGSVEVDMNRHGNVVRSYPNETIEAYSFTYGSDVVELIVLVKDNKRMLWGMYFANNNPSSHLSLKKDW